MTDPGWYHDWRHFAVHELQANNRTLAAKFKIDDWPRYDYNVDAGTLVFSDTSGPRVRAEIQLAGSTSAAAGDWLGLGRTPSGQILMVKARCSRSSLAKNTALMSWRAAPYRHP
jgi:hypothetical protein